MASEDEAKVKNEEQGGEKKEVVTLSKEDYAEMVGQISQMKGVIEQFVSKEDEKSEREEQEKKAKQEKEAVAARGPVKDPDLMSNRELAAAILTEVETRMGRPILQMVSTLAVKDEKRDLEKFCEKQGESFEDFEDEVFKLATEKPTLSLMEAYKIVKSEGKVKAKEEKKEDKKEEKGPKIGGEKPSGGKFAVGGKLSLDQASKKAFEEMKDAFPSD
jgi:hypothetical protein